MIGRQLLLLINLNINRFLNKNPRSKVKVISAKNYSIDFVGFCISDTNGISI